MRDFPFVRFNSCIGSRCTSSDLESYDFSRWCALGGIKCDYIMDRYDILDHSTWLSRCEKTMTDWLLRVRGGYFSNRRHGSNPGEVLCEGLRCTDGKFDWRAWERRCFEAWICNDYDWMDVLNVWKYRDLRKRLKGFELREYDPPKEPGFWKIFQILVGL